MSGYSEGRRRRAAAKYQQARQRNASVRQRSPGTEADEKCKSRIIPSDGLFPGRVRATSSVVADVGASPDDASVTFFHAQRAAIRL